MKQKLDDLLRDPRAHGAEVDAADARLWGERALRQWKLAPLPAPARSRVRWQELAVFGGGALAAAVLMPVYAPLLLSVGPAVSAMPMLWGAAAAAAVVAVVPQLRNFADQLLRG
jgi:hypothetical protein